MKERKRTTKTTTTIQTGFVDLYWFCETYNQAVYNVTKKKQFKPASLTLIIRWRCGSQSYKLHHRTKIQNSPIMRHLIICFPTSSVVNEQASEQMTAAECNVIKANEWAVRANEWVAQYWRNQRLFFFLLPCLFLLLLYFLTIVL